jgi:hypothetical protein
MPTHPYQNNPALRPTVLLRDVMKTVYRPTMRALTPRETPQVRPDATEPVARTTIRAA